MTHHPPRMIHRLLATGKKFTEITHSFVREVIHERVRKKTQKWEEMEELAVKEGIL